jgi:hypothetical protein
VFARVCALPPALFSQLSTVHPGVERRHLLSMAVYLCEERGPVMMITVAHFSHSDTAGQVNIFIRDFQLNRTADSPLLCQHFIRNAFT